MGTIQVGGKVPRASARKKKRKKGEREEEGKKKKKKVGAAFRPVSSNKSNQRNVKAVDPRLGSKEHQTIRLFLFFLLPSEG